MLLSDSQRNIVDKITNQLSSGQREESCGVFSIPAVAGAGKSMMIVEIARRDAHRRILFLCKSKNIAERARSTLPGNVTAHTFIETALQFLRLVNPQKASAGIVKAHSTDDVLKVAPSGTTTADANRALMILSHFYRSTHTHPHEAHVPRIEEGWPQQPLERKAAVTAAQWAWFAQLRVGQSQARLPMSFASLMKWWTLSDPQEGHYPELGKWMIVSPIPEQYDLVIVEEAQLLTQSVLSFLARQRAVLIFFGDGYQALQYGSDKLHHQKHPIYERAEVLQLNESFRFGPSVARICSALASKAGAPSKDWVKGLAKSGVYSESRRHFWEQQNQHYTFLAASPVTLFQEALEATRRGKALAWINGINSLPITLLRDLILLGTGGDGSYRAQVPSHLIETPELRNAPSLHALLERYQLSPNHPISQLGQWVYHQAEPSLLTIVEGWRKADAARQAYYVRKLGAPDRDITLGTVRAAQGHEWPRVALSDDLFPIQLCGGQWLVDKQHVRSVHAAYTGASRAQRGLSLPSIFLSHLKDYEWDVPEDAPGTEIDAPQREQRLSHRHFGIDPQVRLELSPEARNSLARVKPTTSPSVRASGQNKIKAIIEAEAKNMGKSSIKDLRAALRRGP